MKKLFIVALIFVSCGAYRVNREPNAFAIRDASARTVLVHSPVGTCTGVVMETGTVLTAKHCLSEGLQVGGMPVVAFKVSPDHDLMLLKVSTDEFAPLVVNEKPKTPQKVFEVFIHIQYGRIVSIGRVVQANDNFVVHSAVAIPGFSGSGLFDAKGRLVGLNTMLYGVTLPNGAPIVAFGSAVHPKHIKEFLK